MPPLSWLEKLDNVSYSLFGQSMCAAFNSTVCSSDFCTQIFFANSINSSTNKLTPPLDKSILANLVSKIKHNL